MAKNTVRDELAQRFLDALNQNELPWQKGWYCPRPVNPVSGAQYKGINRMMLSVVAESKGYTDPRWCTFNQAQTKGWHIRKGEKGHRVEYWAPYDKKQRKLLTWNQAEALLRLDPGYDVYLELRCRVSTVFNAAQIDGIPELPHRKALDIGALRDKRDTLLANMGVGFCEGGSRAFYRPQTDEITLPPEHTFSDPYSYMATLLHEAGHATGHESRLNRELTGYFGSEGYAKEELRAEIASAFTAQELGLALTEAAREADIKNHMAYIQNWAAVLENDPGELFRAINDAQTISDYLIEKGEFRIQDQEQIQEAAPEAEAAPDTYAIYQTNDPGIMFKNYKTLNATGLVVDPARYERVYDYPAPPEDREKDTSAVLENIYTRFNTNLPPDYAGRSLSVSDVVVIHRDGKDSAYFTDSIGFREVPEFLNPGRQTQLQRLRNMGVTDAQIHEAVEQGGGDYASAVHGWEQGDEQPVPAFNAPESEWEPF